MKSQIFVFLLGNPRYFFHDPGLVLVKFFTFLVKMSLKMLLNFFDFKLVFPQYFLMTWPKVISSVCLTLIREAKPGFKVRILYNTCDLRIVGDILYKTNKYLIKDFPPGAKFVWNNSVVLWWDSNVWNTKNH